MVLPMKSIIAFVALILSSPFLLAADLTGIWLHSAKQPDGHTSQMVLALQQSGNSLTGKIEHPWGALIIKQGKVDGDHFSVSAMTNEGRSYVCEGTLEGDKLHFTVREGDAKPYDIVAARAKSDPFQPVGPPLTPPAVRDLPPNGLAKTPPMGWNSWNLFAGRVDDQTVRTIADAMVSSGMRDAGYIYVNIDDTWEGVRDAQGNLQSNHKFPDM